MANVVKALGAVTDGLREEELILNLDLEHWMTRLPLYLKTVPIIHLAIPGKFEIYFYFNFKFNCKIFKKKFRRFSQHDDIHNSAL